MCQKLEQNSANQPCFRQVIGNTTYVIRVHFSESAKEMLEDKIKRLMREEVFQENGKYLIEFPLIP